MNASMNFNCGKRNSLITKQNYPFPIELSKYFSYQTEKRELYPAFLSFRFLSLVKVSLVGFGEKDAVVDRKTQVFRFVSHTFSSNLLLKRLLYVCLFFFLWGCNSGVGNYLGVVSTFGFQGTKKSKQEK